MKILLAAFLFATGSVHCAPTYSAEVGADALTLLDSLIAFATQHYALAFYLAGLGGMLAHYTKKWSKGEYTGNLWAYLYADKPRASLYAILTYVGAASTVASTGVLDGMKISTVLALGFSTGYLIDSSVNSSTSPRPSDSERWKQ